MDGWYEYAVPILAWDAGTRAFLPSGHMLSGGFRVGDARRAAAHVTGVVEEAERRKRAGGSNVVLRLGDVVMTGPDKTAFTLDKIPGHLLKPEED